MKKIGQVCHQFLPHIGGIENHVNDITEFINEKGHEACVLTTDFDTSVSNRKSWAMYFETAFSFMRNPFSLKLMSHLRQKKYFLFHLHSIWFLPCLFAVFFRKKAKIITTVHGVFPNKASKLLKFFLYCYLPFAKYILNISEKIIVTTNSEKEKLKRIFKISDEKIKILPYGIKVEKTLSQKDDYILFTGRIIPDKNPDILIKAIGKLKIRFPRVKVLFVGPVEAEYKVSLIRLAKTLNVEENIKFIKPLNPDLPKEREKLMDYYRKAGIFVALGSWEGLPIRIIEAMQFKTPVVTYASGGASDLVEDGVNGFVINDLSAEPLYKALILLLSDQNLCCRFGEKASLVIKEKCDLNKNANKIISLYQDIYCEY